MKADGIENWPAERVALWHDAVADIKSAIDDTFGASMHRNTAALIRKQAEALGPFASRVPTVAFKQSDDTLVATAGIELKYFRAAREALGDK